VDHKIGLPAETKPTGCNNKNSHFLAHCVVFVCAVLGGQMMTNQGYSNCFLHQLNVILNNLQLYDVISIWHLWCWGFKSID